MERTTPESYHYPVSHRKPSRLRAFLLLCLLAIGPLQAQVVFACGMMDTVIHDTCCCDDGHAEEGCLNSACDSTPESRQLPCCERSVTINVDQEVQQKSPLLKPPDRPSDIDPPAALVSSADTFSFPVRPATSRHDQARTADVLSESDTYLLTRRLRI